MQNGGTKKTGAKALRLMGNLIRNFLSMTGGAVNNLGLTRRVGMELNGD